MLTKDELRSILSLYHLEELEDFGGIDGGTINSAYWVQVEGRKYFLRISERRRLRDMVYEQQLLDHLSRAQLPVPRLLENIAKGTFTPWSVRGRFVSLFEYIEGRDLGVFEVRPLHVRQIAKLLGRMHVATRDFHMRRPNTAIAADLDKKMQRLDSAIAAKKLEGALLPDAAYLVAELVRQKRRAFDHLPSGTVHGDLFIDRVRWQDHKISGVIDFELSSTERLTWD